MNIYIYIDHCHYQTPTQRYNSVNYTISCRYMLITGTVISLRFRSLCQYIYTLRNNLFLVPVGVDPYVDAQTDAGGSWRWSETHAPVTPQLVHRTSSVPDSCGTVHFHSYHSHSIFTHNKIEARPCGEPHISICEIV